MIATLLFARSGLLAVLGAALGVPRRAVAQRRRRPIRSRSPRS